MQRDEPLAAGNIITDGLHVFRLAAILIGEDHQPVVLLQVVQRDVIETLGVDEFHTAFGEHRFELIEPGLGPVTGAVAQEQHLELGRCGETDASE